MKKVEEEKLRKFLNIEKVVKIEILVKLDIFLIKIVILCYYIRIKKKKKILLKMKRMKY